MKKFCLLMFLIILSANSFFAQTKSNSALKVIEDKANGYSFALPKDWTHQVADGGYILLNSDKTASIVLKPHGYENFEAFAKAEINLERDGFKQSGEVQDMGNGGKSFRVFKPAGDKNLIVDTFFLLSGSKGGLVVASLTGSDAAARLSFDAASQVIKTLKFSPPQTSAADLQIKAAFSGKKLSFYYAGNGYSEQKIIWLCNSGGFISKTETSSTSTLGSGATSGGDQGVWTIETSANAAFLILNSQKGGARRKFAITARQAANEIALNGAKYFVQTQTDCN